MICYGMRGVNTLRRLGAARPARSSLPLAADDKIKLDASHSNPNECEKSYDDFKRLPLRINKTTTTLTII